MSSLKKSFTASATFPVVASNLWIFCIRLDSSEKFLHLGRLFRTSVCLFLRRYGRIFLSLGPYSDPFSRQNLCTKKQLFRPHRPWSVRKTASNVPRHQLSVSQSAGAAVLQPRQPSKKQIKNIEFSLSSPPSKGILLSKTIVN